MAKTGGRSAPMVDPTIIATFWLLLRPLVVLEGVGEVDVCVGVEGMALVLAVVEDVRGGVVGGAVGADAIEERGMRVVVTEDVVVLDMLILDELILDAVALAVVEFDVALDAAASPPSCEWVHHTGFCPSFRTTLKSLLMNVGGVVLEVLRSDTWKWHVQAFPSSRGTRAEPVAETDRLYAGR